MASPARIIDALREIGNYVIADILISLYDLPSIKADFQEFIREVITPQNFISVLREAVSVLTFRQEGYELVLDRVIKRNTDYIESMGYSLLSQKELAELFAHDNIPSLHRRGVTPEMMLLYHFSKGTFTGNMISFLKDQYRIYSEKKSKSTPEEITGEESIAEIEASLYAQEDVVGIEHANWKAIAEKFKCTYDEKNKVYNNVPRGFLLCYYTNLEHLKEVRSDWETHFEILRSLENKLLASASEHQTLAEEVDSLRGEVERLRAENERLKARIRELEGHKKPGA